MQDQFYPNMGAKVSFDDDFSSSDKHPLQLFAEDQVTITTLFLRELALHNFTQRRFQIILTVFNQTLGFNKFEDDMNGSRLQQLTNLQANHANATVRELEKLRVLVIRKGDYGNYMAINFDFSQWGTEDHDYQPTIDPYCLLSVEEKEAENIDQSETINVTDEASVKEEKKPEIKTTVQTVTNDPSDISSNPSEHDHVINEDEDENKDANTNVDVYHNQQLVDDKKLSEIILPVLNQLETLGKRMEQLEQNTDIITVNQAAPAQNPPPKATSIAEPIITSETNIATEAPLSNTAESESIPALRYPDTFTPQQRQEAAKLISKVGDKAQILLDMITQRLLNTTNPLRNAIAYLDTLVTKLQKGLLTFPTKPTANTITTATGLILAPSPSKNDLCKAEYREAAADCDQMERNITMMAEMDNLSFDESLIKSGLTASWKTVKARFYETKEALSLQQHDMQNQHNNYVQ